MNVEEAISNLNILYAEDDDIIRENTSKTLRTVCKNVFVARNGLECLELFEKNSKIDVIILDYVMPQKNGADVVREIRKKNKNIPIFITSNYTDKEKLLNVINLNLIDYLEKPVFFEDILRTLKASVNQLSENNMLTVRLSDTLCYSKVNKTIISDLATEELTKNESLLLELLIENKNSVVSKEVIIDTIFNGYCDENALRTLVYRLRRKATDDVVCTIKNIGYKVCIT